GVFESIPLKDGSPEAGELVVEALYARSDDPASLIGRARRLAALLAEMGLSGDGHVHLLRARLGASSSGVVAQVVPVVLRAEEHRAYLALTERILATWHAGDPLARFLYRGERP